LYKLLAFSGPSAKGIKALGKPLKAEALPPRGHMGRGVLPCFPNTRQGLELSEWFHSARFVGEGNRITVAMNECNQRFERS
jgi:hypothetical protein